MDEDLKRNNVNTYADKKDKNKSQSIANEPSQKQSSGESTSQFVDNRPEAVAQRRLQAMMNNSLQAAQLKALQGIVQNAPQAKQGRVKPTLQMKGSININDSAELESEADVMGAAALNAASNTQLQPDDSTLQRKKADSKILSTKTASQRTGVSRPGQWPIHGVHRRKLKRRRR